MGNRPAPLPAKGWHAVAGGAAARRWNKTGARQTCFNAGPQREEYVKQRLKWAGIGVLALALTLVGLDWVTALTGAATAVCNVGPGLGPIIGPAGNFASLPDSAKWLLSLGMLLGRLEILTVLVLITRSFWKH